MRLAQRAGLVECPTQSLTVEMGQHSCRKPSDRTPHVRALSLLEQCVCLELVDRDSTSWLPVMVSWQIPELLDAQPRSLSHVATDPYRASLCEPTAFVDADGVTMTRASRLIAFM